LFCHVCNILAESHAEADARARAMGWGEANPDPEMTEESGDST
jgi:hypothetical protein